MESKLFTIKVETSQAENKRLETQVTEFAKAVGKLETAHAKVKILGKKLRYEAEHNKEQIEKEVDELRKSNTKLTTEK